jgi:hypothetical protein
MDSRLKDKLVHVALRQLQEGLRAQSRRMKIIQEISDLYNNKTIELDSDMVNIPFPILAGMVDQFYAKIDNPPTLEFKIPNKPTLSGKIQAAWTQEMSSTKAGWKRKDRAEKKIALLSGRGVSKCFASSMENQYRSHMEVVDIFSFVADPTRGFLEDGNYHGETDIFKTHSQLKAGIQAGIYDAEAVRSLMDRKDTERDGNSLVVQYKFDRLKTMGVDVQTTSFAGQEGVNMTEWIMRHDNIWYYMFFDPISGICVRCEPLQKIFMSGKTPFTSWATHPDEFNYWSKGVCDDIYPMAEAIRLILNNALENEKRRTRPMRIVEGGAFMDVNDLQDYVPDNVIVTQTGRQPNIITVETPETKTTINMIEFLDGMIQNKSGVSDPSIDEASTKVGVYYGRLQQEADRIGSINKEYSESYAHKGYRFFWGLKQHLSGPKQIEMLGKDGIKLQQLTKFDFKDVDDVDDVIVSGGSQEAETTAVEQKTKLEAISQLTASYPDKLNPEWVISTVLKYSSFEEEDIRNALNADGYVARESCEHADQSIQSILLGETPNLYMGADIDFIQRIIDYVREDLNYVKLNEKGQEIGIDKKMKDQADKLLAYVDAHQRIVMENMQMKAQKVSMAQQIIPQGGAVDVQPAMGQASQQAAAMPGSGSAPMGTPQGTQALSARITNAVT